MAGMRDSYDGLAVEVVILRLRILAIVIGLMWLTVRYFLQQSRDV